ncbi:MAG: hypothetical protein ACLRZ9_04015 [Eubacterium sp.]
MKINDYKKMYEKMETSPEMDQRILASVGKHKGVRKITYIKAAVVAAAFAMLIGIYQIPSVNAAVDNFIGKFITRVEIENETVNLAGDYIKINQNACKENKKFDTISDVEKELGVKILKSPEAYEEDKNLIVYNPHISEKGELYGAIIIDDFYALGDLKDVKTTTYKESYYGNSIKFESGEDYKGPIATEIKIRAEGKKNDDNYQDRELDYAGSSWDLSEKEKKSAELYGMKQLGIKAVMFTIKTEGSSAYEDSGTVTDETIVLFVYDGIEYLYHGRVSYDTMKDFLDELKY